MRDLSDDAISIFIKTASSLDPCEVVRRRLAVEGDLLFVDQEPIRLSNFSDVRLIGLGKASAAMASAVEEMLGRWITSGIIITNHRRKAKINSDVIVSGHPIPNAKSLLAGERIISAVRDASDSTLIIFL